MAFADVFDMEFSLKQDIGKILGQQIPISMITDSLSLFGVLTKAACTTGKRIMIDMQTLKHAYKSFDINDVALVRSDKILQTPCQK